MFMKLAFASSSTKQIFLAQLKILSQINKHISKSKYISLNQPQDQKKDFVLQNHASNN